MLAAFIRGIAYIGTGFEIIFTPGLRQFILIPMLASVLFFSSFLAVLIYYFSQLDAWVMSFLPSWLQFIAVIFWLLFAMSFGVLLLYGFFIVANLFASPFNSVLSEHVIMHLTGRPAENASWRQMLKEGARAFFRQLAILGYVIPRVLGILLIFIIPGIQVIAPFLWVLFGAWFMMLMYLDYPADLNDTSFDGLKQFARQHRAMSLGFGFGMMCLSMIPIVNIFAMPAFVAGATAFWVDQKH